MTELPPPLSPRFTEALDAARLWHAGQVRKGTAVPYLSHPLAVAALVLESGGDEDEAIAGLLHDAVEDTEATTAEIHERFGGRVSGIVDFCTDTDAHPGEQKPPWRPRKEAHLGEVSSYVDGEFDPGALRVLLADKVLNARSMLDDFRAMGERSWDRFNAPPADQLWYYESLLDLVAGRGPPSLEDRLRTTLIELRQAIGPAEDDRP
jgi:(p)ppGpp synthase/HD superfamily hydrolase